MATSTSAPDLTLHSVIGFGGTVPDGLHIHPNGKQLVYPLGSTLVIKDLQRAENSYFLRGHDGPISCIAVSKTGKYLASGQSTHMGFKADIIIWDYETKEIKHQMKLHKVQVQNLSFSGDEQYLVSIGSQDDNTIVVWDVETGKAICGHDLGCRMSCVSFYNNDNNFLITGGHYSLKVWQVDYHNHKLEATDCQLGQLKRIITCLSVAENDDYVYVGTTSGDLLCVQLNGPKNFKFSGPKEKIAAGIMSATILPSGDILVGGGDGVIALLNQSNLSLKCSVQVMGGVTSLTVSKGAPSVTVRAQAPSTKSTIPLRSSIAGAKAAPTRTTMGPSRAPIASSSTARQSTSSTTQRTSTPSSSLSIYCGTDQSVVYSIDEHSLRASLLSTCHSLRVNDIAFPAGTAEIFATCSVNDIRLWNTRTSAELVRIQVPNLECNCIAFNADGSAIVSGWSDGKIRAFGPETGKLIYVINDAHRVDGQKKKVSTHLVGVTAISTAHRSPLIVSGGSDGSVRVWRVSKSHQVLEAAMKEHKATVNSICVNQNDTECISASDDGSVIIWNLERFVRSSILYAQTYFKSAVYLNDESQILTAGSDKKITFWDAYDSSAIREIEGSSEEIYTVDISPDGQYFVSGAKDKQVKLWHYDEAAVLRIGSYHSTNVVKVRFSPNQQYIASVGEDGSIFIWDALP